VSKNSTPETTVVSGAAMSWNLTISVFNGPASGTVTDTVPAGFTVTSVVESEATITCTGAGVNPVVCTLTATSTNTYSVVINVTAPDGSPGSECTTYQNVVAVTGTNAGTDTSQNSDTDDITVACGSIRVVKDTDPESNNIEFDFDGSFPDFDLEDDESMLFTNLAAGTYDIFEEDIPDDWEFDHADCTGEVLSTTTSISRGVRVHLAAGEHLVCFFDNDFDEPTVQEPPDDEDEPTPRPPVVIIITQVLPTVQLAPPPAPVAEVRTVQQLPRAGSGGYLDILTDRNLWQVAFGSWLIIGAFALVWMRSRSQA
jgi:hypothetical protein